MNRLLVLRYGVSGNLEFFIAFLYAICFVASFVALEPFARGPLSRRSGGLRKRLLLPNSA